MPVALKPPCRNANDNKVPRHERTMHGDLVVLLLMTCIYISSALLMIIKDCDETFGYWEGLHRLVYGYGLQTWEYAPEAALRSYTLLLLLWTPTRLISLVVSKPAVFYAVRMLIGLFSVYCQWSFCRAVSRALGSPSLARFSAILFAVTTGCYEASTAFLPNTLSMQLACLLWASFLRGLHGSGRGVIITASIMALVGWPYALISVTIPLVITLMRLPSIKRLPIRTLSILLGVHLVIERVSYGYWRFPTLSTFKYNVLSGDATLYGVESWSFYLKNLSLSFPLSILPALCVALVGPQNVQGKRTVWYLWTSMISTLLVFSTQAHKEERFLYCIYPNIIILSAIFFHRHLPIRWGTILLICTAVVSALRLVGQVHYFEAPMKIFSQISVHNSIAASHIPVSARSATSVYCMGDDWYRFPSHFFLPKDSTIGWVRPSSTNLPILPKYHSATAKFNDRNREETDQYIPVELCNYFVGSEEAALIFGLQSKSLKCEELIDGGRSMPWSRWFFLKPIFTPVMKPFCVFDVNKIGD